LDRYVFDRVNDNSPEEGLASVVELRDITSLKNR
jgi:hypothetical protein